MQPLMQPPTPFSPARAKSPRSWSLASLATFAAVVLSAGCQQSGAPEIGGPFAPRADGAAVYVLRSVAAAPLPAVVVDNGYVVVRFVADTLRLRPDGSGVQIIAERTRSLDPDLPETESTQAYPLHYIVAGDRIEISIECPPNALMLCAEPPHYRGTVTRTGLRLDRALEYRVPFVYERVDD
jgi:hypothetical protein